MFHAIDFSQTSIFWQTFWGTFIATVVGGVIAALVGYWYSQHALVVSATYDAVRQILSDDVTDRRWQIKRVIGEGMSQEEVCDSLDRSTEAFKARQNILFILNMYDTIMHGVEDGAFSKKVIRRTVWPIIEGDHESYQPFIDYYAKNRLKKSRPSYPMIRKYRAKWPMEKSSNTPSVG